MAQTDEQILTTGEAATLCGVSRSTLRRAVAQGHLQAWHTPGKHLRFTRSACMEFAKSLGRVDLVGQVVNRDRINPMGQTTQVSEPTRVY